MANNQEVLIYVEKDNHVEAEFMSRNFVNKEIKNRAYVNALGAELLMGYLSAEGIDVSDINNIHSISKVLENIDISDVLLPNIHLDVRVVFDENQIFIPKSHSELEIEPDAYVVLKLESNFKHVELLGYFKPSQIDKRNKNNEYYFFEKDKLSPADTLTKFVKEFVGKSPRNLSEEDFLRGRELSISLADHNISVAEEKELLELLLLSRALRESILEFDNFETLSYSAAPMLSGSVDAFSMSSGFQILEEEGEYEDEYEGDEDVVDLANRFETFEPLESVEEDVSLATMSLNENLSFDEVFPEVGGQAEDEELPDATEVFDFIDGDSSDDEDDEDDENKEDVEDLVSEEELEIADDGFEFLDGTSDDDDVDTEEKSSYVEETFKSEDLTTEESLLDKGLSPDMEIPVENMETDSLILQAENVDEVVSIEEITEIEETPLEELVEEVAAVDETSEIDATEEIHELVNNDETLDISEVQELNDTVQVESIESDVVIEDMVEENPVNVNEVQDELVAEQPIVNVEEEVLDVSDNFELGLAVEDGATLSNSDTVEDLEVEKPIDVNEDNVELEDSVSVEEAPLSVENLEMDLPSLELEEMPVESLSAVTETEEVPEVTESLNIDENVPTLALEEAPSLDIDSVDLGDDLLGGNLTADEIVMDTKVESFEEDVPQEPTMPPVEEVYTPTPVSELSVDAILDQTIAAIDSPKKLDDAVEEVSVIDEAVQNVDTEDESVEEVNTDLDKAAEATASALVDAVANEDVKVTVSDDAMNLASVAGDMVNDAVQNLESSQQVNLNKIDYANTDIVSEIDEVPDNLMATADDLSLSKLVANLEAEESGLFAETTDISNLNAVDAYEEEAFVHDTVNFGAMETVSKDKLIEQGFENSGDDNLSNFDMPVDNFNLPEVNMGKEEGVVDLPQFSSGGFTINEDGSSPMDKMLDMGMAALEEQNSVEGLMDMDMNAGGAPLSPDALDFSSCMKPSTRRREESRSSSSGESKSTLDEETKKILLANNITRSSDNDDLEEDFGETITIPVDDEPFEISATDEDTSSDELSLDELDALVSDLEDTQEVASTDEVQPSVTNEQQDWMTDNDYAELQDVTPQVQDVADDFITEPEVNPKEVVVSENSVVISDRTFRTGEVPIDINVSKAPQLDGPESLQNLYDPNSKVPGGALLQNPGRLGSATQGKGASGLLGIVGTLIVLALVGGIGFGVSKFFKSPTDEAPQPITDEPIPTSTVKQTSDANTLKIDPNNVVNMDNNYDALATTSKPSAGTSANTAKPSQKKGPAKTFVEIKEMKWLLPDYISRDAQFQQYFQSVGKSLKLSLTTDLLLASDYIYSDQMKVAVTFGKDGSFQTSQVIVSSGSNQIDRIVLQTVNQTLKSLKAPNSVGNDENTTAVLNISF